MYGHNDENPLELGAIQLTLTLTLTLTLILTLTLTLNLTLTLTLTLTLASNVLHGRPGSRVILASICSSE
jgi:hypothetical protein